MQLTQCYNTCSRWNCSIRRLCKIADVLKAHGENFEAAFKEYQEERIPRSARVQTTARFWGEIIHAVDPVSNRTS